MGYNPNRIDFTLADVVASPLDFDDGLDWEYGGDWDWDYEPELELELDREPYYHGYEDVEYDLMAEAVFADQNEPEPDPYEHLPFIGKVSPAACLGERTMRPGCRCCGGVAGVRRAWRRRPKFNVKPKRKEHRMT